MGTTRQYYRLSSEELAALRAHPNTAWDTIFRYRDKGGPERVCDIDKWWREIDLALPHAGISPDEAFGAQHLYPLPAHLLEEFEALDVFGDERRPQSPPTYLTAAEVRAIAPRLAAVDLAAAFDAVEQGPWEPYRDGAIEAWASVAGFYTAAAAAGDAVLCASG